MWPFKSKREQHNLILCEDRKIDSVYLPIPEKGYMTDEKTLEAWYLIHKLLLPYTRDGGKSAVMTALLSERDAVPLAPFSELLNDEDRKKLADTVPIAKEALHKQLQKLEDEGKKNIIAGALKFVMLVTGVLFALVVLINLI